jgi:FAD:protein FMN transferase
MNVSLFKSPRRFISIIAVLLLIATLLGQAFFVSTLTPSHLHGFTMGTKYNVKYRHYDDEFTPDAVQKQIESILDEINRTMSTYDPQSELSRLNQAITTDWIPISDSLFTVLDAAMKIGWQSKGSFDITVGPLVNLWGFGPEFRPEEIPDEREIAAIQLRTGQDKLVLDRETPAVRKAHSDTYIDLSAIAKGYAVDQIAEMFDSKGINHYLVEIGGEIRARGSNAQNTSWQIGIEKPQQHGRSLHKVLPLNNTGLATSGDYRNFYEIEGQRYSHLIDPTTGWPVKNGAASVTVFADNCMNADAWATALLVLGHERGLTLAENQGLAVLFIVNQDGVFKEYTSSHFPTEHTSNFTVIFLATFLIMGLALIAMAIGVLNGRRPIGGSCGGLGRLGLGCDAGCSQPCARRNVRMAKSDKPVHEKY